MSIARTLQRFAFPLLLALAGTAVAQDAPDVVVRKAADDVLAVIKTDKEVQAGNTARVAQLAEEKVLPFFNFSRMTQLAMGRNWQMASDAQKEVLTREFKTLLVRTYSTALLQYRNQTIEVRPVKAAPGDTEVVVKSLVIQPGGQPIPIDYSMEKVAAGWKVYDVLIDGVSLVTNYRGTFNDQVRQGGVDGLIKSLQSRNQAPARK
jgi:phospholipid transport system substrate-binding protein